MLNSSPTSRISIVDDADAPSHPASRVLDESPRAEVDGREGSTPSVKSFPANADDGETVLQAPIDPTNNLHDDRNDAANGDHGGPFEPAGRGPRSTPLYSVVAPVYNEHENLEVLYDRLAKTLTLLAGAKWEIVMVDDGSKDGSWEIIERLHAADPRVVGLRFSRNFGHHIALAAGIDAARGDRVVTMDSDLQDQPEEIPTLAAKMDEGYDLVYATRTSRQHGFLKKFTSKGFLWILNRLSDVPEPITGAVFRMMNRPFVDELKRLRERHRLFTGMTAWLGFRQTTVEVVHAPRYAGKTKYGIRKMLRLSLDSVTAFSAKPLFLMMYLGMAISLAAVAFGCYIVIRHLFGGFSIVGWASIMASTSFFSGIILMALGIVGQYVGRIYEEQKGRPMYVLQTRLQQEAAVSAPASPSC